MDGLQIALAVPDELPALAEIERAAAALFPPEDVSPALAASTVPLATLEEARARGRLWVARLSGRPVGFLVATLVDGAPFVIELDVLPAHHRRGVGTALLRAAMAWARAQPVPVLTLTTFRHLPFNAPFYARLGFEEIPPDEQGPELEAQLADEVRRGLDREKRVALRLRVVEAGPAAAGLPAGGTRPGAAPDGTSR